MTNKELKNNTTIARVLTSIVVVELRLAIQDLTAKSIEMSKKPVRKIVRHPRLDQSEAKQLGKDCTSVPMYRAFHTVLEYVYPPQPAVSTL
jgi:hypothetical protein